MADLTSISVKPPNTGDIRVSQNLKDEMGDEVVQVDLMQKQIIFISLAILKKIKKLIFLFTFFTSSYHVEHKKI